MSLPGGKSDKLGNQFEAVWTVDVALDVFEGRFKSITVEPFGDESLGVEFYLETNDNNVQFHSVKRQKQGGDWSIADLCRKEHATGRSILGDLFSKRIRSPNAETRFVSSTGANELRELCDRAVGPTNVVGYRRTLSAKLQAKFATRIVPLCGNDSDSAFEALKACEVITRTHKDLVRSLERRIGGLLYRIGRSGLEPGDVRRLIAEFILDNLGQTINAVHLRELFHKGGIGIRDWKIDKSVNDKIALVNRRYLSATEAELINSAHVARQTVGQVVHSLADPTSRGALLVAPGGFGKPRMRGSKPAALT